MGARGDSVSCFCAGRIGRLRKIQNLSGLRLLPHAHVARAAAELGERRPRSQRRLEGPWVLLGPRTAAPRFRVALADTSLWRYVEKRPCFSRSLQDPGTLQPPPRRRGSGEGEDKDKEQKAEEEK